MTSNDSSLRSFVARAQTWVRRSPVVLVPGLFGCSVDYQLDAPPVQVQSIAETAPIDLLFVVDNSPSMGDEQLTLQRTIFDERCPIRDLDDVPAPFANASAEVLRGLVDVCGVSQLLAAVGGDFHIGVITTDMATCDEHAAITDVDNVHSPVAMRGCLQTGEARDAGQRRYFTREDDIAARVNQAMAGVGTYGSPRERGLDALQNFLTPDSARAAGCEHDLDGFLRNDAQLVVVFVTDEDDCSHAAGAYGMDDELADEPVCGEDGLSWAVSHSATECYSHRELLAPTNVYVDFMKSLRDSGRTRDVYVGVVGGMVPSGETFVPGGCRTTEGGAVDAVCQESFGAGLHCEEDQNCCSADGSSRYYEFAQAVNQTSMLGTICANDFRSALSPLFFAAAALESSEENDQ